MNEDGYFPADVSRATYKRDKFLYALLLMLGMVCVVGIAAAPAYFGAASVRFTPAVTIVVMVIIAINGLAWIWKSVSWFRMARRGERAL